MNLATYFLTCADKLEANKIAVTLLQKKFATGVKQMPVSSAYWWDDKIQHNTEILLMIESTEERFKAIETVVSKLHSYDQPALTMIPIKRTTPGVEALVRGIIAG